MTNGLAVSRKMLTSRINVPYDPYLQHVHLSFPMEQWLNGRIPITSHTVLQRASRRFIPKTSRQNRFDRYWGGLWFLFPEPILNPQVYVCSFAGADIRVVIHKRGNSKSPVPAYAGELLASVVSAFSSQAILSGDWTFGKLQLVLP